jgi:hypothetical protein
MNNFSKKNYISAKQIDKVHYIFKNENLHQSSLKRQ